MIVLPFVIACLIGGSQLTSGAVLRPRDGKPKNAYHKDTTPYCTWWLDYDQDLSCDSLLGDNFITIKQFRRWNPSVSDSCKGLTIGKSYCVEAAFEPEPEPEPSSKPEPKPKTTKKPEPSPTKAANGIETPSNIQPGIVSNCDDFYLVKQGDGCAAIASKHGITLSQFITWNSKVGPNCSGLWADSYACISVIGHSPAPAKPTTTKATATNGVETPSPLQEGVAKNCNKFHLVKTTTSCKSIEDYYHLPLSYFYKWNPSVGTDCRSLIAGYHVCVSVVGWKPPTPTQTTKGNGIPTPTPIQDKMVNNCNKFHMVKATTTCKSIETYYNLPLSTFYKWNPSVGTDCRSLLVGYNVCVSVVGWKPPTPTQPAKSSGTPSPIQAGMVKNCKKFHLVKKTTTCDAIQKYYKITMANLFKWNPAIGSKCTSLWADYYVCVGV
ncbi:hypothetical protein FVER53263_20903 [Fusarium verticillioides]|nr:hypothetical protein FVER53263_20903 [Fusarium verticillioides]